MPTTMCSRIATVDHATVPSTDLLAGRAPIFFLDVAAVSGFGLFLQDEYPPPARRCDVTPQH